MKSIMKRYPVRFALLAATLVALTAIIWNAWPYWQIAVSLFIWQAVLLSVSVMRKPSRTKCPPLTLAADSDG